MDNVNKTLYIPLYGKAYVSRKGILLDDPKAEEIWAAEGFPLKGKSKSKWLAYYMGMRSAVFDRYVQTQMEMHPGSVVLHLGCGLDSRVLRVGTQGHMWYDVDFPEVIRERQRFYDETDTYKMISGDLRESGWRDMVAGKCAIVVLEGVSMYLRREELHALLEHLAERFDDVELLMDCYTEFAARMSRVRNPVKDVGVSLVYGLDDPRGLESAALAFVEELPMTPAELIDNLQGMEKTIFRKLYAGKTAGKLYRMYAYSTCRG